MKDIHVTSGAYEQTLPDKKPLNVIYVVNAIHYVVSGRGYFNGKLLKKGQGFVCPKDIYCSYHQDPEDPWAYVWIRLDGLDVTPHLMQYAENGFVFDFKCDESFAQLGQLLINSPLLTDTDYAASAFQIFYSHQADYQQRPLPQTQDIAWKAKEFIMQHYYQDISIEELAEHLHVNRAYLRNAFFKREGISPKNYLIRLRLNQAKQLLKTGLSVRETAVSVGYSDMFQFSKIFKKYVGCSPKEYASNQTSGIPKELLTEE